MQKSSSPKSLTGSALLLAIPAVAFLVLYMTDTDFTPLKQAVALLFAALLFVGAWHLSQQCRHAVQPVPTNDRHDRHDRHDRQDQA